MLEKLYKFYTFDSFMAIKNTLLGLAIIILTLFVVVYGIHTFYPSSEYEDYCSPANEFVSSEDKCLELGGNWVSYNSLKSTDVEGYCDQNFYCNEKYNLAREDYAKNIFFITLPLGIFILLLGGYFFHLTVVGAGIMGGGIGTLLYGVFGYWSYGEDWLKFVLSLIGLILLIWFVYWLNRKKK